MPVNVKKLEKREHTALMRMLAALEEFRKLDPEMPIQQAVTFLVIAANEGLSLREVAERTGQAHSSTSRNVAALGEVHRYGKPGHRVIAATEDPLERRKKTITLTHKGRTVLKTIIDSVVPDNKETVNADT